MAGGGWDAPLRSMPLKGPARGCRPRIPLKGPAALGRASPPKCPLRGPAAPWGGFAPKVPLKGPAAPKCPLRGSEAGGVGSEVESTSPPLLIPALVGYYPTRSPGAKTSGAPAGILVAACLISKTFFFSLTPLE